MCRWTGSHFHDWSDYNGVAFSIELLEWGCRFSDFWSKQGFKMGRFSVKKSESCCLLNLRNGPDKKKSNNGNENVGMQKRC